MLGLSPAPELFKAELPWFNVSRPLHLSDLKGRFVVLDFWTASCVNCLHVLPTLRRLEDTFADKLVVIGVHCPKYPAERAVASVRNAILRHDIRHPIVHDPELQLWADYGISAWPTLVFVDPCGGILGDLPGEPAAERLIAGLGEVLRRHCCGPRFPAPPPLPLRRETSQTGRFRFPAGIKPLRGPDGKPCWAIADSGHHQIVVCDDDGREIRRFGSGKPGFLDLPGAASAFCHPQGLACDGAHIFVADAGNHAIRRIDLATGAVMTLAGTGERGGILCRTRDSADTALASVWDIECAAGALIFANAGTHQLGRLDLANGLVSPLAGDGQEGLRDGCPAEAQLAQPTGLAIDRTTGVIYFVDSETSAVRAMHPDGGNRIETLVGAGLFEYGRRNGPFAEARLQHCRGIACQGDRLVVADSYNGALRIVDPRTRCVSDLLADPIAAKTDIGLNGGDPSGIAVDGPDRILVADTNHHRIVEMILGDVPRIRAWAT
ncbi:MAG: redoxin domain-containing protein [Rhodospirillales bacterium]|nr:redoxin domain-containing protein [Rhodospirillales bacterium]